MDEKSNCVLFAVEMEIRFSFPTLAPGYVCMSTHTHNHTEKTFGFYMKYESSVNHMLLTNKNL